ncbi:MAG TPA: gluconolaconase, partial [Mycobacterium sp.]
MRVWLRRKRIAATLAGVVLIAACSTDSTNSTQPPAPTAEAPAGLVPVTVQVDPDLAQPPFDEPRQATVPAGWTLSVWARVPKARLAAWAPDASLLVSVPSSGQVVRVQPNGAGARMTVPLDGLDQPHGLAFSGSTLYVAESDQIDAYDYADGAASNRRTVAAGLPDGGSPDLRGEYAHALKSVAVGPDGALYFSIGSTGNITAGDRTA